MFSGFQLQIDRETRRNFNADLLAGGFYGLFAGGLLPFLTVIGIRIGADNLGIGLITAAPCVALLAAFYYGMVSQDRPKVPFVVWPNVVGRGLIVLMAIVTSPWPYVAVVLSFWLIASIASAPYSALMEKIYPVEYRGRLLAYVRVAIGICQLITVTLAGKLLDVAGYRVIFPIAAVCGVLSALTFGRIREPLNVPPVHTKTITSDSARQPSFIKQMSVPLRDRLFMLWQIGFAIFGLGNLFLVPVYALFQVKYLGLTNAEVGFYSTVWTAAWLMAYPFWGTFIDRHGPARAIVISIFLFGACGLSYYLGRSYALILVGAALNGVAEAAIDIGWMNQCIKLAPGRVSIYSGVHLTFLGIRGTIGPMLGASLAPVLGLLPALLIGSLTVLAGAIPMLLAYRAEIIGSSRNLTQAQG